MGKPIFVTTVAALIDALKDLPQDAGVIGASPPFDGVKVVPQSNGKVLLIADRERAYESKAA
jgi:hypothetical protein